MSNATSRWFFAGLALIASIAGCDRSENLPEFLKEEASVIDGDTVVFRGRLYQLHGIDAPELGQQCLDGNHLWKCGEDSAFKLHKMIVLDKAECEEEPDHPGELVCDTAYGPLAAVLLQNGAAITTFDIEHAYAADEAYAQNAHLGIWRGRFVRPSEWRAGERLPEETERPLACPILAVSADGRKRYVVPTDADYAEIESAPKTISKRFCSDDAARAAGWRWYPAQTKQDG